MGVGEAALGLVELERGDAEVHEDALHEARVVAVLGGDVVDVVVGGVHRGEPVGEGRQAGRGERDGLGVAVDADDAQRGKAPQGRLRVPAHPEGGVDEHRAGDLQGGGEELEAALGEHGHVQRRRICLAHGVFSPGPRGAMDGAGRPPPGQDSLRLLWRRGSASESR